MQPFFSTENGVIWSGNQPEPWIQLGVNFVSVLCIIAWSAVHSLVIFGILHYFGMLRIDPDTEFHGSDVMKHGEAAYPINDEKKINFETSTQTILRMSCDYAHGGGLLTKCKPIKPTNLNNEKGDCILMDNFHTILNNVNLELSPC